MDSEGSSGKGYSEENSYMEAEAKKVHLYIGELRRRIAHLQTEGDEIEKTTENMFGEEGVDPSYNEVKEDNVENSQIDGPSSYSIEAIISEATGFTSLLRKFENMKYESDRPEKSRENSEIRQLREQNGNIRDKIKQIQSRIERAQIMKSRISRNPSKETFAERETCTQLYEATANTLRKVDIIEEEIRSVESFFMGRTLTDISKDLSIETAK